MTPEEIQGDYTCTIRVEDFRVSRKAEYKVVVHISFYSSRRHGMGATSWHIWRSFSKFRKLDEYLRKRIPSLMKGIQFPPLYRRRLFLRSHLTEEFLATRMRELDTYLKMVTKNPSTVAFHLDAMQCQTLKAFIGFVNGFGMNNQYELSNVRNTSNLHLQNSHTSSVVDEEDDDFRSIASTSTYSHSNHSFGYRWSGTGFQSYGSRHMYPISEPHELSLPSFSDQSMANTIPLAHGMTLDKQRAKMEHALYKHDLMGVGMPPDGSCLLHCIVYEMYPTQCLKEYPTKMTIVHVGAADGMAPRRVAAAQKLRVTLMQYGLDHISVLSKFLHQKENELRDRFECFRDIPDEQATAAELYVAASMFNLEIVLISNEKNFNIEPVTPVEGLTPTRIGARKTVIFGYIAPVNGCGGHYICTRHRNARLNSMQRSIKCDGTIAIGPPRKSVNVRYSREDVSSLK